MRWPLKDKSMNFSNSPLLMGIVNITPDSFFDGGRYHDVDKATKHAFKLIKEGAGIIDLGAESSRPGADPVNEKEELGRLLPVLKNIRKKSNIPISIDTYKPIVAEAAIDAGADIINDITASQKNDEMLKLAAEKSVPIILMHMKGNPQNMQSDVSYNDVYSEVVDFLSDRIKSARALGVEMIAADPGIGFGKLLDHNLELIAKINRLKNELQIPVLLGASRKSFIAHLLGREKEDRLAASLAVVAWSVMSNVDIIRVHDVKETKDVIEVISQLQKNSYSEDSRLK